MDTAKDAEVTELVMSHQCAYGASTMKPTCILTTAAWMKKVCSLCFEVRYHVHSSGGLLGNVRDYQSERMVWRTSLAAEYPCRVCVAWTKALQSWLQADGWNWPRERTFVKISRWQNTLVRLGSLSQDGQHQVQREQLATDNASTHERREMENRKAWGGLRSPRFAVMKSASLREVGRCIRSALATVDSERQFDRLEGDFQSGVEDCWLDEVRKALAAEFQAEIVSDGLQGSLWSAMLRDASDPDASVLPEWIENGFLVGISRSIQHTNIFPKTQTDSAAVEASRLEGHLVGDEEGSIINYKSFLEAGEKSSGAARQAAR